MSLVNLSHVCSHLQNASLARLGLTSIPYSKLHLSLALLLHKQGFLSQVKIGGASPPASCFSGGTPNDAAVTAQPYTDRSRKGATSAVMDMVANKRSGKELKQLGYNSDEISFALAQKMLSKEQLQKDGWETVAIDFLLQYGLATPEALAESRLNKKATAVLEKYQVKTIAERLLRENLPPVQTRKGGGEQAGENEAESKDPFRYTAPNLLQNPALVLRLRSQLVARGIDVEDLRYFAQNEKYSTLQHLERDGVTVQAMGLDITGQPFTPLPEEFTDVLQLEQEGVVNQANRASRRLWLGMKYWQGKPVLSKARMLSRPTKRIWMSHHDLGRIVTGNRAGEVRPMTQIGEIIAVSTDKGIMEARECVERKIGGQVLCRFW